MENIELGAVQERFADLVWANEPIASGELVQLCEKELNWNKSTTYTVLRMLCQKGLLKNEKSLVTSRVSKEEYYASKSERIVNDSYKGSLPAFIAAFTSRKKMTAEEADEIQKMINAFRNA
ncbi:MAG: BlaI/MecI/CopY family transcriptional regulator [Lachnospiraceae bacterium]|nr:BlaI/MecI/CopY family transcriptional regulator [Lachnospiraceae bacterium]